VFEVRATSRGRGGCSVGVGNACWCGEQLGFQMGWELLFQLGMHAGACAGLVAQQRGPMQLCAVGRRRLHEIQQEQGSGRGMGGWCHWDVLVWRAWRDK